MALYPVILSGGSGSRLWPLSREHYPKPLLPLVSEKTLLQETANRLDDIEGLGDAVYVCNEEHRFLVAEQVAQIGKKPATIILEPEGRNTAPALTLAAL
jgi:mannose-1-phosphate guanylyltransferase